MFNSWGLVNAYGTWSSYYVGHSLRTVDQLELNLIGSSQCFLVLLLSNPVGRLLDAGHYRKVIGFGTVLVPLGLFILSAVHPSSVEAIASFGPIWATQGLVVGLGMAPFFVSSSQGKSAIPTSYFAFIDRFLVAATWFPKRRGLAVGYVACGASIAGVIYPTMLRYLIEAVGFNNAVRYVATLTSITCIYSFIFATPNPMHEFHKPESWFKIRTWFDTDAFHNKAWCWFTAAVAFMFFGFYPIFFNLEEVCTSRITAKILNTNNT
jgi:MCP family monocarboxylic acid transporter-like MFS transporter 10